MSQAYEYVKALSLGQTLPAAFSMAWGVHEGMRGATWTILDSEGSVRTNTIKPTRGPFVPQKPTELGKISADELLQFAAILCAQRFDLIQVPPTPPNLMGGAEVELAISLPDERFSLRCPSASLSEVYGLAEIGRVFNELRKRFVS